MSVYLLSLISFGILSVATSASGQELKIGFVNTDRVFKEAAPALRSQKKLQEEFAPRDQEIKDVNAQATRVKAKLEKDGLTMAESEKRALESELARLSREIQRLQREFREELNLRKQEELKVILRIANEEIDKIAAEEKYDLILQEAVYRSDRLDITDKVIKALEDD
ncbi:MAG: OmpH family outer membrane protein [Burkholderiales bacterium]|nr:OmpH family outer membrane protein [Burkholderiales bacterium]